MGVPLNDPATEEENDRVAYETTLKQLQIFQDNVEGM